MLCCVCVCACAFLECAKSRRIVFSVAWRAGFSLMVRLFFSGVKLLCFVAVCKALVGRHLPGCGCEAGESPGALMSNERFEILRVENNASFVRSSDLRFSPCRPGRTFAMRRCPRASGYFRPASCSSTKTAARRKERRTSASTRTTPRPSSGGRACTTAETRTPTVSDRF